MVFPRSDEQAVSPVIGVILMVAITVILAAVIGAFVLGIGASTQETPRATFEFEKFKEGSGAPDELRVTHAGGDAVPTDDLYMAASVQVQHESGSPGPADRLSWSDLGFSGGRVEASDSVLVEPPNGDPEIEDKTFQVVWSSNGQSAVLSTWSGPSA